MYPELPGDMDGLGFHDILRPGMLATAGRFMTIPKGAAMKRISLGEIAAKLKDKGYSIEGGFDREQSD